MDSLEPRGVSAITQLHARFSGSWQSRQGIVKRVIAVAVIFGGVARGGEGFEARLAALCLALTVTAALLSGVVLLLSQRSPAKTEIKHTGDAHVAGLCSDQLVALSNSGVASGGGSSGASPRRHVNQVNHHQLTSSQNISAVHKRPSHDKTTGAHDGERVAVQHLEYLPSPGTVSKRASTARQTLGSWHASKVGCSSSAHHHHHHRSLSSSPSSSAAPSGTAAPPVPEGMSCCNSCGDEILHVEDDPVQRMVARRILTKEGFRVVGVESAEEALEFFRERYASDGAAAFPSVVLMDAHLPGACGLEAVCTLRKEYPDAVLPIIMVTVIDDEKFLCDALDAGCSDYAVKPLSRQTLLARIRVQLHVRDVWRFQVASRESEGLLKQILPQSIIARLLRGESRISDALPEVSILFTEIVNFDRLQTSCSVTRTIEVLNRMFCAFDDLTDLHKVFKVETVGDTYMCVAGHEHAAGPLLESSDDDDQHEGENNQVERLVALGKDLLKASAQITLPNGEPLQLRIGIHTGPAYSGVVGHKCPRFCFFGDTVNTASRMKSTCQPGCIHLSDSSYERLLNEKRESSHHGTHRSITLLPLPTDVSPGGEHTDDAGRTPTPEELYSKTILPGLLYTQCMGYHPIKGKGLMKTWMLHPLPRTTGERISGDENDAATVATGRYFANKKSMIRAER